MATREQQLQELIEPALSAVGYELWGIEYLPFGDHATLRVYIDQESGIDIEDCATASRQISAVMDVEDPIKNEYTLEVSSPGLERPLFNQSQYQAYCGDQIAVKLFERVGKLRKAKGTLVSVNDDGIEVEVDNEVHKIAFSNITKANVVFS